MSEEKNILEVEHLKKSFKVGVKLRPFQALSDVSFSVKEGEIYGFLGPNGAGKTTTIKTICNLVRPEGGTVKVLGGSFKDPAIRQQVGLMPEHAYYHEYLTAREFLQFHGKLCGLDQALLKKKIPELLERVGLSHAMDRALRKFSKGMLQRVGLAQAIIADPKLLILDEPLSGLDPIGRADVRNIMLDLQKEGKTIFFSTHILSDVEMICERLVILNKGKTIAEGKVADLIAPDSDHYEVQAGNVSPELKESLLKNSTLLVEKESGLVFEIKKEDVASFVNALVAGGALIIKVEARRPSLEDVFLDILKNTSEAEK